MGFVQVLIDLFLIGIIVVIIASICIGIGIALGFLGKFLFYRIRGVPKEQRQHESVLTIIFACVFSGILIWVAIARLFSHSPSGAFQAVLETPMPSSVRMRHHSSSVFFSSVTWIHFTIDPDDLRKILDAKEIGESFLGCGFDDPPSWWNPESLGLGADFYDYGDDDETRFLYVNATLTEAYGCQYYKFRVD